MHGPSNIALVAALVVLVGYPSATVRAAAPSNDEVAAAIPIETLPFETTPDTKGATVAPSDPKGCFDAVDAYRDSVWYAYRAQRTEPLRVSAGPGLPYVFAAVDVTGGAYSLVACSVFSRLAFEAQAGRTYAIMVAVHQYDVADPVATFRVEGLEQRRVPFRFEPSAAMPGQEVTVYAGVDRPNDVPCYPLDATLLFSRDPTIIERENPGLFNPLEGSSSASVFNPPVPIVQRWRLPAIAPGTYATYWQCNEPSVGPEVWRGPDFRVLTQTPPSTDAAVSAMERSEGPTPGILAVAVFVAIATAMVVLATPRARTRYR